ncbi:hypothetical protein ACFVFS_05665 [Kitasatospora sp. NPDC057692]|uniref:hypothetical protein n=1 Tax=Kitasatospora sp. NPDC057692 TaxID=3346215 RepID=UPI0036B20DD1
MAEHTVQLYRLPDGGTMIAEEHTLTNEQMRVFLPATGGTIQLGVLVDPDRSPDGCVLPPRAARPAHVAAALWAARLSRLADDVRLAAEGHGHTQHLVFDPPAEAADR